MSSSDDARRVTLWLLGAVFAVHLLDRQIFAILLGAAFLAVPALLAWSAFHHVRVSPAVENCKASPGAVE